MTPLTTRWNGWSSLSTRIGRSGNSQAAKRSAPSWHAASRRARRSCCWTSHSLASTNVPEATITRLLRELAGDGATILVSNPRPPRITRPGRRGGASHAARAHARRPRPGAPARQPCPGLRLGRHEPRRQLMNLIDFFLEPLSYDFMVRALATTLIASIVCAVLSCWLVLIGWSLMGDAVLPTPSCPAWSSPTSSGLRSPSER